MTLDEFNAFLANPKHCDHPLRLGKVLWPKTCFYDKQIQEIESVRDSLETYVVAGNQLGV